MQNIQQHGKKFYNQINSEQIQNTNDNDCYCKINLKNSSILLKY